MIGLSHIIKLLSVTDADGKADRVKRLRVQRAAISGNWSRRRLEQEILYEVGLKRPRRPGGRTVGRIEDLTETLHRIAEHGRQWKRLRPALTPQISKVTGLPAVLGRLDTVVEQVLQLTANSKASRPSERRDKGAKSTGVPQPKRKL